MNEKRTKKYKINNQSYKINNEGRNKQIKKKATNPGIKKIGMNE